MADQNRGSKESTQQRTDAQNADRQERTAPQERGGTQNTPSGKQGNQPGMPDRDRNRSDQGGSRGGNR